MPSIETLARFSLPAVLLVGSGLAVSTACSPTAGFSESRAVELRAEPVPEFESPVPPGAAPAPGRLRFRAGFHLTAARPEFGGFSGLAVDPSGDRLTAVSDRGWWLSAEVVHDASGTLTGFGSGRMGPLLDADGRPVAGRYRRDAEELLLLPGPALLVTFEAHHRIHVYAGPTPSGEPQVVPVPEAIEDLPENQGLEAAAFLGEGDRRLLVFSEHLPRDGGAILGWLAELPDRLSAPEWRPLSLAPTGAFQPTGAATLPSGDVLLLERSYSPEDGTRVRLSRIEAGSLVAGATLRPRELARLEPPVTLDNMEATAARQGPSGETLVYLLADDNFSDDQRTLLMQYELLAD